MNIIKKVKRITVAAIIIAPVLFYACSSKQQKLEYMKKQYAKLEKQIAELEKELNTEQDNTAINNDAENVTASIVHAGTFSHFVEVQGHLDSDENIAVGLKTAGGTVKEIFVEPGQNVSKGQLLAQLDDEVFRKQLDDLKVSLEFVTDIFEKQKRLYEQKISSEMQYLTAKNNKESLEQKVKTLKEQIDMYRITAPVNGTIEDITIKKGESVSPMYPPFRIVNFDKIKAVADVAETFASKISQDDEVTVYIPDIDKEVSATVSFTSRYINPANRTFSVEANIKTPEKKLKANMLAVLKIADYTAKNAVSIPFNFIQNDNNGSYILTAVSENKKTVVRKTEVTTGHIYNGMVEITTGLKEGDTVITSGYLELEPDEEINIKN